MMSRPRNRGLFRNLVDTYKVESRALLRSPPGPGEVGRRTIAVFLMTATSLAAIYGSRTTRCTYRLLDPTDRSGGDCDTTINRSFEFWLVIGALGLLALILWFAPWQRFIGAGISERDRRFSLRARRRASLVGGVVLLGLGVAMLLGSMAGWFINAEHSCSWFELWCDGVNVREDWTFRFGFRDVREGSFSRLRLAGVALGLSTIWWGLTELKSIGKDIRKVLMRLLIGVGGGGAVAALVADLGGAGWPGFGQSQLYGLAFSVTLLLVAVALARAGTAASGVPHDMTLFVAMSLSIALGAWVLVLGWGPDWGRSVGGRPARDFWGEASVALPFAAAGAYLAYARLQARRAHADEVLDEAEFQVWSQRSTPTTE